jgi:hypothetical protein
VLDEAHAQGLTVTLGLELKTSRTGFDYGNDAAVAEQLKQLREVVIRYKDHPALLMWGVGNEINLTESGVWAGIRLWRAMNDIAEMIHEVDPNHPTATMLPGYPEKTIMFINFFCPAIDLLCINTFGNLPDIDQKVKKAGWDKAFVVTEWGPTGYWEARRTQWDVALEETSSQKAQVYLERYASSIAKATNTCLGSYVFYWGNKQERTHTWFSLFMRNGDQTNMVDAMQYLWTSRWPENRTPEIEPVRINGKGGPDNVMIRVSSLTDARVVATDPDGDAIHYNWEIYEEATGKELKEGGDGERIRSSIQGLVQGKSDCNQISFVAPAYPGAYRLFVYASDGHAHTATANIPFYVMP